MNGVAEKQSYFATSFKWNKVEDVAKLSTNKLSTFDIKFQLLFHETKICFGKALKLHVKINCDLRKTITHHHLLNLLS